MGEYNDALKEFFPNLRGADQLPDIEVVKTRWPSLNDIILGCGGIPRGRTIELYGPPSAGKTTVALNIVAEYHRQELATAWDDREGTFPGPEYTDPIGVNRPEVYMQDTSSGEDASQNFLRAVATNFFDLYVIDSMAMMVPDAGSIVADDMNWSMHQSLSRAKLLTQMYQQLRSGYFIGMPNTVTTAGKLAQKNMIESNKIYMHQGKETKYFHKLTDKITTAIFINHMKTKPGVSYGDAATTPGGDAGKFDASVRLRVTYRKKSKGKSKNNIPDFKIISIRADKNKVGPPLGEALFFLMKDGRLEEYDKKAVTDTDLENVTDADMG